VSAASLLAGLAAALAAAGGGMLVASAPLSRLRGPASVDRGPALMRLLVRAGVGFRPPALAPPRDLEARIAAAGRPAGLGSRELMAA
jgi:hypothetical protein